MATSSRSSKKARAKNSPARAKTPTTSVTPDECRVQSFSVGHGDCTLVEYVREGVIAFRCLVDCSTNVPEALLEHLRSHPREAGVAEIDTLVLSHVDADHQGGMPGLLEAGITVQEYLGPCLPTFRRLSWLFAPRVADAVERAAKLEAQLEAAGVTVTYPLEGYVSRHAGGRVELSVLSPASRLLKRLSAASGPALADLLARPTLPLQWLLDADVPEPIDDADAGGAVFDGRTSLVPSEVRGRLLRPNDTKDSLSTIAAKRGVEPEFFGNNVLNDTSLVVVLDVHLDGRHRKRLLLTGDQENWTYIAARYPAGLGVDVLKAPHHGGRLYLCDREEDFDSLYLWLRPRTVIVSANGRHNLPRQEFRDAVRKVGATLFCPCVRTVEPLTPRAGDAVGAPSCFVAMGCRSDQHPATTLVLKAHSDFGDRPACVQGTGGAGVAPIVVLNQHVTTPSEGVVRYTRAELERHANWMANVLQQRQQEFVASVKGHDAETAWFMRAQQPPVPWSVVAAYARADSRHELAHDPSPVMAFARAHRKFWSQRGTDTYRRSDAEPKGLYRLPTKSELKDAWDWLAGVPRILLCSRTRRNGGYDEPITLDDEVLLEPPVALLQQADWTIVVGLLAAHLNVPAVVAEEEVLPAFLPEIVRTFSLKICSLDSPLDYRFRSSTGGTYFLLERGELVGPFPNVHSMPWQSLWNWRGNHNSRSRPWHLLRAMADELLAGNFDRRRLGSGALWTSDFDEGTARWDKPRPSGIGELIHSAKWDTVWSHAG